MDQSSSAPVAPGHKTYVFVDEYNRHKRLKVMRACDGCRKRKIRCDGAIHNGPWPCGACVRLKLICVPPTLDQDDESYTPDSAASSRQFTFQNSSPASEYTPDGSSPYTTTSQDWKITAPVGPTSAPALRRDERPTSFSSHHIFSQQPGPQFDPRYPDDELFASPNTQSQFQSNRGGPPSLLRTETEASSTSSGDPQEVDAAVKELSEQMGDLSIDLTSVAPYIAKENKVLAGTPAVEEEADIVLPPSVGSTISIPPEMMPSEERAMDYFGYFFNYVHPYVPVLHRDEFYKQWHTGRHLISPLVLEGIFACVARYLEQPIEVRRWLALASRHEESFKDVPRLSTIQALIILTKAREFVPKRGYYYRSWMAVKYMTTMAFDLGLHEHVDRHRGTATCKLIASDCLIRTRIWQTLFVLEMLVGAPQGRTDFAVDLESVDFGLPPTSSELDAFEHQTSRRATYFAQAVRNIKQTNTLWQTMRRVKKDWALDPQFVHHNEAIGLWLHKLPSDMQIHYEDDDSPPSLGGDHHVAYLHTYNQLVIIMHHRPQLQALLEKGDPEFTKQLDICNESAILICRLQEALFIEFGLHGLQFMQRGIGFTIYCVLTCTMLHLATITSPDLATNSRARTYFTRHMRILEHCIPNASQEMQEQINTLREAFSQDTSRPFELKPTLGMRSPSEGPRSASFSSQHALQSGPASASDRWAQILDNDSSNTMSPASEYSQPFDELRKRSDGTFTTSDFTIPTQPAYAPTNFPKMTPQMGYALEPVISNEQIPVWNPSGIFQQWNTAFGPSVAPAPQASVAVPGPRIQPPAVPVTLPPHAMSGQQILYSSQPMPVPTSSVMPDTPPAVSTVTPVMWQNAFTNAYASGQGQKRHREDGVEPHSYSYYQKRRAG